MTPSFYVRNPEAHGLVSSSALSIWYSTVNFCCSAHSPQLLKGPVCDFKSILKSTLRDANPNGRLRLLDKNLGGFCDLFIFDFKSNRMVSEI